LASACAGSFLAERAEGPRGFEKSDAFHDPSNPCGSMVFRRAHRACVGIARSIAEKQARIQGAATNAGCRPPALLLCLIEAIEVAFARQAPRIFLSASSLGGQGSSQPQCAGCKRRKSSCSNSAQELSKRFDVSGLNMILGHVFSLASTRGWIASPNRRPGVRMSYSGFSAFIRAITERSHDCAWKSCVDRMAVGGSRAAERGS
jgi:hypothetical protein